MQPHMHALLVDGCHKARRHFVGAINHAQSAALCAVQHCAAAVRCAALCAHGVPPTKCHCAAAVHREIHPSGPRAVLARTGITYVQRKRHNQDDDDNGAVHVLNISARGLRMQLCPPVQ